MVNQSLPTYDGTAPTARERKQIVDQSGREAVIFDMDSSESGKIRIWDQVDETWTSPLERANAMDHYLAKVLFKCSGCTQTSLFEGGIEKHLAQLKISHEFHVDAELERGLAEGGQMAVTCSGCGAPLSMRKNQGQKHIDRINETYQAHIKEGTIDVLLMHRYTTSPSVSMPVQTMNTVVFADREPEVHQEKRSDEVGQARRRRRKRRNR